MAEHHDMRKTYYIVFAVLIAGTILTVVAAVMMEPEKPDDPVLANMIVALLIATVKASCVAAIFMHLKFDEKILRIAVFFPLSLLLVFVLGNVPDTSVAMKADGLDDLHKPRILKETFTPGPKIEAEEPDEDDEEDDDEDEDEC